MSNNKHIARIEASIQFADGKTRTIFPLTIKSLRKFVKIIEGLELGEANKFTDETVDKMAEAASIVLEKVDPALAGDREALEEALDMDIFGKIMSVAMGNRVSDTKNE